MPYNNVNKKGTPPRQPKKIDRYTEKENRRRLLFNRKRSDSESESSDSSSNCSPLPSREIRLGLNQSDAQNSSSSNTIKRQREIMTLKIQVQKLNKQKQVCRRERKLLQCKVDQLEGDMQDIKQIQKLSDEVTLTDKKYIRTLQLQIERLQNESAKKSRRENERVARY